MNCTGLKNAKYINRLTLKLNFKKIYLKNKPVDADIFT